ncbi:MAG TPA: calcium-binding protein [Solirubrobacterales bacterium]|nr:calcium-binding protein [Solirubrobacterales bacterium]
MPRRIAATILLGLLVAAYLAVAAAGAEDGAAPMCDGHRATIVGTAGDDVIQGTEKADVIWAGPGDDKVYGGRGNDIICGGPGDDLIHGGRGNDWIEGGGGTDRVFGDLGDDHLNGGAGNQDEVSGGLGIDSVNGGPGNEDLVRGDYGYDRMDGGPGKGDIASFSTAVAGLRGSGVWVSLPKHRALGDGHDRLFRFESIEGSAFHDTLIGDAHPNVILGGPGNDKIIGGGGRDTLNGGQGTDSCRGGPTRISCGPEPAPVGSAYVTLDPDPAGGGGLQIVGGGGRDDFDVSYAEGETKEVPPGTEGTTKSGETPAATGEPSTGEPSTGETSTTGTFTVDAAAPLAAGEGCTRTKGDVRQVTCATLGPARWLMADLGPGNDKFTVDGSLEAVDFVRVNGGDGNDIIHGGPEEDLLQSGPGSDHVYGGDGSDGLIGGLPGPTYLYGEGGGDLLAAGGGCAGGTLDGGPGEDDASFAETQAHPGTLYISLEAGWAWIDAIKHCDKVRLPRSDEDIEGSFDNDVLIGDARDNVLLGQPGVDSFFGRGGNDVIVAADGVKDWYIQCGNKGRPEGTAIIDAIDPEPKDCAKVVEGGHVQGLGKAAEGNGSHPDRER